MKNLVLALMLVSAPLAGYSQTAKDPVYSVVPMSYTIDVDTNLVFHFHITLYGEPNHTYVLETAAFPDYTIVNTDAVHVPNVPQVVHFELAINPAVESKSFWVIGFVPRDYRKGVPMNNSVAAN